MTIKELKKQIENLPDHMDVVIKKINDEFPLSLVESAYVVKASFSEEVGSKILAKEKVFLISDEI